MNQKKKQHFAWIWNIWKEKKSLIALLFLFTLISSIVTVAYPWVLKIIIDSIQQVLESGKADAKASAELDRLIIIILLLGLGQIVQAAFPIARSITNSIFEALLRIKYFRAIIEKSYEFFHEYQSADVTTRLTEDISENISWFMCSGIFRAIEASGKILFCLTAMFYLNIKLTFVSLICVPILIIIYKVVSERIYDASRKNQEAISAINTQLEMSFAGARIIKAFRSEEKYKRFFKDALNHRYKTELRATQYQVILNLVFQYIETVAQVIVIIAGGLYVIEGSISIGTFYAFYNYLGIIIYPILDIPNLFISGKRSFASIDRLEEMKERDLSVRIEDSNKSINSIDSISFQNVSLKFPDRENKALDNVSFSIKKGTTVCLIGPIGSGKTSILRIMLGLVECKEGKMLINNLPFSDINPDSYRKLLAWVPQDPLLFKGSIKDNIAFGSKEETAYLTEEDSNKVIEISQLKNELESFSLKENTVLGIRGQGVSGGQRQRIACARAFARNPEVLLLDDITASLDAANEIKLLKDLKDNFKGVTCIMTSHRLSSINYSDLVILIDNGTITAMGSPKEIANQKAFIDYATHAEIQ